MSSFVFFNELNAQQSITLSFSSDKALDSVRIDNLNNASYKVLKDAFSIVLHLNAPNYIESVDFYNHFYVYPNPFSQQLKVNFRTFYESPINVTVFDLSGKLITQLNQNIGSGSHIISFKPNNSGVYILRVADKYKSYNAQVICSNTSTSSPCLEYVGVIKTETNNASNVQSKIKNIQNELLVSKDNLLRFTGYSNANTNTIYDVAKIDNSYNFKFPVVENGVYLNTNDSLLYGLDTIRCFASRTDYSFGYDLEGKKLYSKDSLVLKPVTNGAVKQPEYSWQIDKSNVCRINTSFYSTGTLYVNKTTRDTAIITLKDEANNLTKKIVLIVSPPDFTEGNRIALGTVEDTNLKEISGIVASVKNPGCYWVHNDSGDDARIFLINSTGKLVATVYLDRIDNRDWEDITIGPGPIDGETYLYIGDIGDNNSANILKYIYRFKEPIINTQFLAQYATLERNTIDVITYQYYDGNRDAEILMIDPLTKDLYVVTKRETSVYIYALAYPQSTTATFLVKKATVTLPFRMTNGGDISANGTEILIKNLTNVFYWKRADGETIVGALSRKATILPYIEEPQGEAIAWLRDGTGYVTVSEINNSIKPVLYLYKRRY
jgi:hypothetical protein